MQGPSSLLTGDERMGWKVFFSLLGLFIGILVGIALRSIRRCRKLSKPRPFREEESAQAPVGLSERKRPTAVDTPKDIDNESDSDDAWSTEDSATSEDSADDGAEDPRLKMVIVILRDTEKLRAQQIAVCAAGAAVSLAHAVAPPGGRRQWRAWRRAWSRAGCTKIALRCPDEAALRRVVAGAEERRLPWAAGPRETDEAPAVVAIGPAPSRLIDPVTGSLKLFS